jgi:hypothetical protein
LPDLLVVQESEFIFPHRSPLGLARVVIEGVIIAEVIFIQDLIHQFTSFTAKAPVSQGDFMVQAVFTAVSTVQLGAGSDSDYCHNRGFLQNYR